MNDEVREEILDALRRLGNEYPTFRFGQLVATMAFLARGPVASAVSEVEDEEFLSAARRNLERRASDRSMSPEHGAVALLDADDDVEGARVSATGAGQAWPESNP